jgi:Peptidase family C50
VPYSAFQIGQLFCCWFQWVHTIHSLHAFFFGRGGGSDRKHASMHTRPSEGLKPWQRVKCRWNPESPRLPVCQSVCQSACQGTTGEPLPAAQLVEALAAKALFIYFGHGSGAQFLAPQALRRLDACPAALLMGCSSGRLKLQGAYEPSGHVLSYVLAGASHAGLATSRGSLGWMNQLIDSKNVWMTGELEVG